MNFLIFIYENKLCTYHPRSILLCDNSSPVICCFPMDPNTQIQVLLMRMIYLANCSDKDLSLSGMFVGFRQFHCIPKF